MINGLKRSWAVLLSTALLVTAAWGGPPPADWYRVNTEGFIEGYGPSADGTTLFVFDGRLYAQNSQGLFLMNNAPARVWTKITPPAPPNGPGDAGSFTPLGNLLYGHSALTTQTWWIVAGANLGGTWNQLTSLGLPGGGDPSPTVLFDNRIYGVHPVISGSNSTFEIWRTSDIGMATAQWERIVGNGFGDPVNNKGVDVMIAFGTNIYAGTDTLLGLFGGAAGYGTGVEIWESSTGNSGTWSQVNVDGFGTMYPGCLPPSGPCNFPIHQVIGSAEVYQAPGQSQEYLYIGTKAHYGAEIWRYDGSGVSGWSNVTPPWAGPCAFCGPGRNEDMVVFEDNLYLAEGYPIGVLAKYDGSNWTQVVQGSNPFETYNGGMRSIVVLSNRLYVSTVKEPFMGVTNGDQVWSHPLTPNSWTNPSGDWWELATCWSAGSPGASNVCFITNAASKTVKVQSTIYNPPGPSALTVTHLVIDAPSGDVNTLILSNLWESPFRILDGFRIEAGGAWVLGYGATQYIEASNIEAMQVDGNAIIAGGVLVTTNGSVCVGCDAEGKMIVSNGLWQAREVVVGSSFPANGVLSIAGGAIQASTSLGIGVGYGTTGVVDIAAGTLTVTNAAGNAGIVVGISGRGQLTLRGGIVDVDQLYGIYSDNTRFTFNGGTLRTRFSLVANGQSFVVGDAGGTATLELRGSIHSYQQGLTAGHTAGSTGTIDVQDCQLVADSAIVRIGDYGVGQMVLSAATGRVGTIQAAWWPGSEGKIKVLSDARLDVNGWITLGDDAATTGRLWVAGNGQLIVTNGTLYIGGRYGAGLGETTISNGVVRALDVQLGSASGSVGYLTLQTGVFASASSVKVGREDCNGSGIVEIYNGTFTVTNAAGTAVMQVCSGSFVQHGGTVRIDKLVLTNECVSFDNRGGSLRYGELVFTDEFDADGDGLPNRWEQSSGLDPLSSVGDNGADGDPDLDGQPNDMELLAGTAPKVNSSVFRISGLVREGDGVRVLWTTATNHNYVVQTNTMIDGQPGFADGSPVMPAPGAGEGTTNWFHSGGASLPAAFYRIRLYP